jgi:hypothetical protein
MLYNPPVLIIVVNKNLAFASIVLNDQICNNNKRIIYSFFMPSICMKQHKPNIYQLQPKLLFWQQYIHEGQFLGQQCKEEMQFWLHQMNE